ncbi:MAG: NAD(P)/FAD-dependent oxidoreductase [Streptococcaceae bacterium]|jgi:NADH dehydrogenase|nr:NAD(P)/FAD-dependent oxidoreductase [Streptococcaceae bacterium]
MSKHRIVVVGAGYAGLTATRNLSSKLKDSAQITLIDRHPYHTSMTQLHEVAAGRVSEEIVQYDLQKLVGKRKNVQLVTDEVTMVDKEAKVVTTANGTYEYDFLVVALGGEPNDFGVPGVKEHGFTLWSMEDALRIRRHLEIIVEKAALEPNEEKRRAMLTFAVAGSGFTGIEMAGELIEWKELMVKKYRIPEDEITIAVVEMMDKILNIFSDKGRNNAFKYMQKKGVKFFLNSAITEVGADHIKIKDAADIPTHTLIWTTGVQGNTQAKAYGMQETERGNRLVANKFMQAVGFEDKGLYVAGDLSAYTEPETGRPTPQIVEAAELTGHTAAANILAEINGTEKHEYKGVYKGTMVSIGARWGVASLSQPFKSEMSGFMAMATKHFVYLLYAFQIRSAYYMFQYLSHEIFRQKDNRELTYGHLSRSGNVLWAVPLRIFFGLMWLLEAMGKVLGTDGKWLQPSTWFGAGSWFTTDIRLPFAWLHEATTGASDAASGATGAVTGASDAATGATGAVAETVAKFGLSYKWGEQPMPVFDSVPSWMEPIMRIMIPNADVAIFFQRFMTLFEIVLALALIFGIFTWLFSAISVVLTVMFALSGMFVWVNIWFIPVGIALMNGSGRAFGVDRYLQPWLQKWLGGIWYGKSKPRYGEK